MKEILTRLEEFDKAHGWDKYNHISDDKERLQALKSEIINLLGELGEFANQVKKCSRDNTYEEDKLKEEATDMFIFLLKITKILDMNMKEEFNKKMDLNDERFKHLLK